MADLQTLESALKKAHAAGDTAAAKTLIKSIKAERARQALPKTGSILDPLAQGVSFGFADELAGLTAGVVGAFEPALKGTTFGERYRDVRDTARQDLKSYRVRQPYGAAATEIAGGLLPGGLAALKVAPRAGSSLLGNALRNIGAGGAYGGAYGAGISEGETIPEIAKDTAKGAGLGVLTTGAATAAGLAGRGLLKRAIRPDTSKLHDQSVRLLESQDIPLTTGQKTGSQRVRALETDLGQSLWGPKVEQTFANQRSQFQKSLMRLAGFESDDVAEGLITEHAIRNAKDRFAQRYGQALKGVKVKLDSDDFIDALANIEKQHQKLLPRQQKKEIADLIEEFLDEAAKPLTGEEYQAIRSQLGVRQRALEANNPTFANLFRSMKRALDDAFLRHADDAAGQIKMGIDQEYSRFKQLERLYKRSGGKGVEEGILPLASLNRESKKARMDPVWRETIGAASRVLPDSVPSSGTAGRGLNQLIPLGLLSGAMHTSSLGVPYVGQQLLGRGIGGGLRGGVTPASMAGFRKAGLLALPATNVLALPRN